MKLIKRNDYLLQHGDVPGSNPSHDFIACQKEWYYVCFYESKHLTKFVIFGNESESFSNNYFSKEGNKFVIFGCDRNLYCSL